MGKYILADNQELTRLALISLIKQNEENTLYVATDKAGLVELLKEHEDAIVLLDFTLFDFAMLTSCSSSVSVSHCRSGYSLAMS